MKKLDYMDIGQMNVIWRSEVIRNYLELIYNL